MQSARLLFICCAQNKTCSGRLSCQAHNALVRKGKVIKLNVAIKVVLKEECNKDKLRNSVVGRHPHQTKRYQMTNVYVKNYSISLVTRNILFKAIRKYD